MWHDLMKRAISTTTNNMVLANKYKQMKNMVQQAQAALSNATMTTSSTPKTTQKQYTITSKTKVTTFPQTAVMKPLSTSASQSSNKNQNWIGNGQQQVWVLVPVLWLPPLVRMVNALVLQQDQEQRML